MIQIAALLALLPQSSTMFPFVIPWNDAVRGTATDVSFLNAMPAGKNGKIVVRNGRFVEANTGARVRFFGVNMAGRAAFPSHADADKIAARLAKAGVNIVRMHHLQNDWDLGGGTIWKEDKMQLELDPVAVDKLDYFIAALKKKGVYTNLNLQTTRKYLPSMGFAESVTTIPWEFCKKIDKVDRHMIALQKEYAKWLIDRKNPYTGLAYKDEPALAVVEINNENSLVGWPGERPGAGLETLPEPFRGEIVAAWNKWLKAKYTSRTQLEGAWSRHLTLDGPSLVGPTSQWTTENQSNGDVKFELPNTPSQSTERVAPPITVTVNSNPGPDWHVQIHQTGLALQEGDTYTVSFTASCSSPAKVHVNATLDESDWANLGFDRDIEVGPEPKSFRFAFPASGIHPNHNRIAFQLGNLRGTFRLSDFLIKPGVGMHGVGEGFEQGKIDLPTSGSKALLSDYADFLAETEAKYSAEMRDYLRKDLGVQANLIDTQISWGGLTSLVREDGSDFADNHEYWEHPEFPRAAWSGTDWQIRNSPLTNVIGSHGGTMASLAAYRVADKPYTISEYQHPAPSDFRAEMMPIYASFAAAQDWDGIYMFCYDVTGEGLKDNDRIQGFFSSATDPSKVAFYPATALMFRAGAMPRLSSSAVLTLPNKPYDPQFSAGQAWSKAGSPDELKVRKAIRKGLGGGSILTQRDDKTVGARLETADLRHGKVYSATGTGAVAVTGYVGGNEIQRGDVKLTFPEFGNSFAAATVVATDNKALGASSRVLITIVGKVENQDMVWNSTRTSVADKWGHGPTVAEAVPCTIELKTSGTRYVWALDSCGRRVKEIKTALTPNGIRFEVGSQETLWYEVAAK